MNNQKEVLIYSTPVCVYCKMAKDFFNTHGVKYTEISVAGDKEKLAEMIDKSGQRGVPVIQIGEEIVIGFDEEVIKQALGIK